MKKILSFWILIGGFCCMAAAQQTALTADGKLVILYKNGTWKYANVTVPEQNEQTSTALPSTSEAAVSGAPIRLKDNTVPSTAFIEGPSKKLQKYFKDKNIVRCNFTLSSKDGKARLQTDWKIMNGEAYSYFGFIKAGSTLSLELVGGQTIDLVYSEEFEPTEFEKYGFSSYSAHLDLSEDQIRQLQGAIVYKAHMNWSKRTEEYTVVHASYFVESLPKILD